MSSFNLAELISATATEKENNSFRKYMKNSKPKLKSERNVNELDLLKDNKNILNKSHSNDFSVDFLESIEKCLRNSFSLNENGNDFNQHKKNSYLCSALLNNEEEKDVLNNVNLDSLIQKSNNLGFFQDSIMNKLLESKSFDAESSSLNHENAFSKGGDDKKWDQNDTYFYQIEQILKNFEEDDEKKQKIEDKIIEDKKDKKKVISPTVKDKNNVLNHNNEHIMIVYEDTKNIKEKKKKLNNKCCIF